MPKHRDAGLRLRGYHPQSRRAYKYCALPQCTLGIAPKQRTTMLRAASIIDGANQRSADHLRRSVIQACWRIEAASWRRAAHADNAMANCFIAAAAMMPSFDTPMARGCRHDERIRQFDCRRVGSKASQK